MKNQPLGFKNNMGFTLVEMAIVLVILGFVLSALLLPLRAQREQSAQIQTNNTLELAKQALLGFAQSQGRLPCPATAASNIDAGSLGQENPLGGTRNITPPVAVPNCATYAGYLPAATLGLQPADGSGFVIDAWNNRIRYVITSNNNSAAIVNGTVCGGDPAPDFTTAGNMAAVGLACLAPNLRVVCGTITTSDCTAGTNLTNNAVAVIFSTGKNFGQSAGVDETSNLSAAATTFYSRTPTAATAAPSNEFDDMVIWISPFVLYNAMIQAGQLH